MWSSCTKSPRVTIFFGVLFIFLSVHKDIISIKVLYVPVLTLMLTSISFPWTCFSKSLPYFMINNCPYTSTWWKSKIPTVTKTTIHCHNLASDVNWELILSHFASVSISSSDSQTPLGKVVCFCHHLANLCPPTGSPYYWLSLVSIDNWMILDPKWIWLLKMNMKPGQC